MDLMDTMKNDISKEVLSKTISTIYGFWDGGITSNNPVSLAYKYLSEERGLDLTLIKEAFQGYHPFIYNEEVKSFVNKVKEFNDSYWYDQYLGYLFLPVLGAEGYLTGFDLRKGEGAKEGAPRFMKIKVNNGMIYTHTKSSNPTKVIVCESIIDAITCHQLHKLSYPEIEDYAVSSPLRAVMDEYLIAYYAASYKEVIFLYDSDERGEACRNIVSEVLGKCTQSKILEDVSIKTRKVTIFKDPNEFLMKQNKTMHKYFSYQFLG